MGEGRHIRKFPEHLRLVGEQVAEVSFWQPLYEGDEEAFIAERWDLTNEGFQITYDHYDFCVEMKDGRDFVFTACTPEWVRQYLQREDAISFGSILNLV